MIELARLCVSPIAIASIALVCFLGDVKAVPVSFTVDPVTSTILAGSELTFTGVITNQSGQSLSSSDFFLNFFNYDPAGLNTVQILGATSFTLPNNTFSAHTALFSVQFSPALSSGMQFLSLTLGDFSGNLSDQVDLALNVGAAPVVSVPEPSSLLLLAAGLLAVAGVSRRLSSTSIGLRGRPCRVDSAIAGNGVSA